MANKSQKQKELEQIQNQEKTKSVKAKWRDQCVLDLFKRFHAYGYKLSFRKLNELFFSSIRQDFVLNMEKFMKDNGYSCCAGSLKLLEDTFNAWNASKISYKDFKQMEEAKDGNNK
jgi:hypothetical protein